MTAEDFFRQGNEYRKKGDLKKAMNCYLEAKKMLEDIFNFYNKDAYNP